MHKIRNTQVFLTLQYNVYGEIVGTKIFGRIRQESVIHKIRNRQIILYRVYKVQTWRTHTLTEPQKYYHNPYAVCLCQFQISCIYHNGDECDTLIRNASVVCPDRVLPLLSTIVPDINTGQGRKSFSNRSSIANRAALEFAVSNIVSTNKTSAPPFRRPLACSL